MTDRPDLSHWHIVSTEWRAARAAERLRTAQAIDELLAHLADVELALEGDEQVGAPARSLAAVLRSKRTELESEWRRLEEIAGAHEAELVDYHDARREAGAP